MKILIRASSIIQVSLERSRLILAGMRVWIVPNSVWQNKIERFKFECRDKIGGKANVASVRPEVLKAKTIKTSMI